MDSLPEVQDIADNGHAIFLYDGGIAKAGEFLDSFLEVTGVNDLSSFHPGIIYRLIIRAHIFGEMIFGITCEVPIVSSAVHVEHQEHIYPPFTRTRSILRHIERLQGKAPRTIGVVKVDNFGIVLVGVDSTIATPNAITVFISEYSTG